MQPEYEQTWISRDGHRLGLRRYPPPARPDLPQHPAAADSDVDSDAGPLVLLVPGMGVPAGYYGPFVRSLREQRIRVAALDLRGTGDSQPTPTRGSRYGYAELAGDLGAALDRLAPDSATDRVVLLGHSLGGQLSLLHLAASEDKRVTGLALVAAGLPHWRSYRGWMRYAVWPFAIAIDATASLLGVWPGWGFGGRQSSGVMRDWAYTGRTARLPPLDGVDVHSALRQLEIPVLAVSVDHDQFTPRASVDQLCELVPSAGLEREHYPAASTGKLDHFRWARTPGPIADRVARFVHTVSAG